MTKFTEAAVERVAKAMAAQFTGATANWMLHVGNAKSHLAAAIEIARMPMCQIVEPEPPKVDPDEVLGRKILGEAVGSSLLEGGNVEVLRDEFAKVGAAARKLLKPHGMASPDCVGRRIRSDLWSRALHGSRQSWTRAKIPGRNGARC